MADKVKVTLGSGRAAREIPGLDANGSKISPAMFAEAYRQVVPVMAPANHVTIAVHPNRMKELSPGLGDVSAVVEIGYFTESGRSVTRITAVPMEIHPNVGAELVSGDDIRTVDFRVNGMSQFQIINLAVTGAELKAESDAKAKADADAQALQDESTRKAAFEAGRQKGLAEQAESAGKSSVAGAGSTKVQ